MRSKKFQMAHLSGTLICLLLACLFFAGPSFSQEPFYKGKTIAVIHAGQPGGTGDMRMRSVMPFLQKYIPGNPTIVAAYMPGGGGRKGANHIFKVARPDGLTIAHVGTGLATNAVLGETGVLYDLDKLIYLGMSISGRPYIFSTVAKLGLNSVEKLRAHSGLRIGAQGVGHPVYINGRFFAWFFGLKDPRFVTGYSGPELDLALENGELDARANLADTVLQRNPEWVKKGFLKIESIIELPKGIKHPSFPALPDLEMFARSPGEIKVLNMQRAFTYGGHTLLLPPGTPADRVKILREAVKKTFADPAFAPEFKKLTGADPSPLTGEEVEKWVKDIPWNRETIDLFKKLAGAGPLPPR
ncbi:MAG: hypothetical protein Q8P24_00775 [Desulfobacterales bacterium]|nr:hypothetical protein [Desulfobacterales bacterium]